MWDALAGLPVRSVGGSATDFPYAMMLMHDHSVDEAELSSTSSKLNSHVSIEMSLGVDTSFRGDTAKQQNYHRFISRYWLFPLMQAIAGSSEITTGPVLCEEEDHHATSASSNEGKDSMKSMMDSTIISNSKRVSMGVLLHCAALLSTGARTFLVKPDGFWRMRNMLIGALNGPDTFDASEPDLEKAVLRSVSGTSGASISVDDLKGIFPVRGDYFQTDLDFRAFCEDWLQEDA